MAARTNVPYGAGHTRTPVQQVPVGGGHTPSSSLPPSHTQVGQGHTDNPATQAAARRIPMQVSQSTFTAERVQVGQGHTEERTAQAAGRIFSERTQVGQGLYRGPAFPGQ